LIQKTLKVLIAVTTISTIAASNNADSAQLNSKAHIRILEPITFVEEHKLNFGVISTPDAAGTLELSSLGVVLPQSTVKHLDKSEVSAAKLKIFGSNSQNISISAEYLQNEPAIDLVSMAAEYEGEQGDLINSMTNLASSNTGKTLTFGANLAINDTLTEGNYYPALKLSINYE